MIGYYQTFAWLIISALGSLLVCSLGIAGEQVVAPRAYVHRIIGTLPITLLAAVGVMVQVCFPAYYSVGYGYIRLIWLVVTVAFVFQALANKYGRLQRISGVVEAVALGVVLSPTIFGVEGDGVLPAWRTWVLGGCMLCLATFMGAMRSKRRGMATAFGVAACGLFIALLCLMIGVYTLKPQPLGILENLTEYWFCGFSLALGIILIFAALMGNIVIKDFRGGFWLLTGGVFFAFFAIISAAGLDNAAILPIVDDQQRSVTLSNGSAPLYMLKNATITTSIIIIALVFLIFRKFAQNFSRK